MATQVYPLGADDAWRGNIDWINDDIRAVGVTSGYSFSAAHGFLSNVGGATRVVTSGTIPSRTVSGGVLQAGDTVLSSVTGSTIVAWIVYKHTGTESTSRLLAYIDSGTGMPVTPNGENITIDWHDTNGVISLTTPTS